MAYDPQRRVVLQFGGNQLNKGFTSELWSWDGVDWLYLGQQPIGARVSHAMVYDTRRGAMVVHGGVSPYYTCAPDTWALAAPALGTVVRYRVGCPGPAATPELELVDAAALVEHRDAQLSVSNVPSGVPVVSLVLGLRRDAWQGGLLPLSLQGIGANLCSLWVRPDAVALLPVAAGQAVLTVPYPILAATPDGRLHAQGAVLDASAPGGLALSIALQLRAVPTRY